MKKVFLLGALGYPLLELAYRRRTHWTMAIAGGASALLIDSIRKRKGSLLRKMLLCGAGITGIEYLCGILWNRKYTIWDYRSMPFNLSGQICAPYTLLWCGLSGITICLLSRLDKHK